MIVRRTAVTLLVVALLVGAAVAILWFRSAPYRRWDSQAFAAQSGFTHVAVDSQIERLEEEANARGLIAQWKLCLNDR